MSFFTWLSSLFRTHAPHTYDQARAKAQSPATKDRLKLARSADTHPEILYYLAEHDTDPRVRRAVTQNDALPLQAAPILAGDPDNDVRLYLVQKLCRLLPELDADHQAQLYAFVVQSLGQLALDEVLKIRVALASSLKDAANAPPRIAGQLARDIAQDVAEPILRHCLALEDTDILAILESHPADWAVAAIAGRPHVSEILSKAVIDVQDERSGAILLSNQGADLTPSVFQHIIEKAKAFPSWHQALATHAALPRAMAVSLARIVDDSVRTLLCDRPDMDMETIAEVASMTRRRMDLATGADDARTPAQKLQALLAQGEVGDDALGDVIGIRDRDLAIMILAYLAKTTPETVTRILDMRAPKPIIALCWKAKLSMRTALLVQKDMAGLGGKDIMLPRGGTDYPLSQGDLQWQIDFLNL
ncbi:MAG: DUF2336 domain-containing protein [Pseudomonadota bacterium]